MKKLLTSILMLNVLIGCSYSPNTPERICEVYLTCINAQKWELASRFVFDSSLLQLSPLLTKNYQFKQMKVTRTDYARDSSRVRVYGMLISTDDTYLDSVFMMEKDADKTWKIRSI